MQEEDVNDRDLRVDLQAGDIQRCSRQGFPRKIFKRGI